MNLEEWLKTATKQLSKSGISTARLDCLVLLEDITGKDRAWLIAHPDFILDDKSKHVLDAQLLRRAKHEPLSYIRGKTEFYGREFIVNAHTLEPRPETETMIDLLKLIKPSGPILDIGTGSGCLAITAKLEFPETQVYATDIDKMCIKTARQNAKKHDADIKLFMCDLLESIPPTTYHLPSTILANLPYVPDCHTINQAAMFEPKHAIFGGKDGLDCYRQLFIQIDKLPEKPRYVLTESIPFQHQALEKISNKHGFQQTDERDFIQLFELQTTN